MKKIKSGVLFIILPIMLLVNLQSSFSSNRHNIPMFIEVGLFFGQNAKSTVRITSSSGFNAGKFNGSDFSLLLNLTEHKELLLRKDSFYAGSGSTYIEQNIQFLDAGTINLHGPYHVQIGETFQNLSAAEALLYSLNIPQESTYLVFENGWKVFEGLYANEEQARLKAEEIRTLTGNAAKVVLPSAARVQVIDSLGHPVFMYDSAENIYFKPNDKGTVPLLNVEGKNYRGAVTVKRFSDSDMTVINKLPLEEYLYGVVPREMPASWNIEALKAQAVVARSYAVANQNRFMRFGFDLCSTTVSQVYGGYDGEHPNSKRAVDETRSRILTYNGQVAGAFYHSNSGGHTEDSENVWSTPVPYIRGVKDEFSLDAPHSTWVSPAYTNEEIRDMLEKQNIFVGDIIDLKITALSPNGRVLALTVYGTQGTQVLEKGKSRTVFGLRSTWFTVNNGTNSSIMVKDHTNTVQPIQLNPKNLITSDGVIQVNGLTNMNIYNGESYRIIDAGNEGPTFVFQGRGFGHGLGMSQHGARRKAELGYNFVEILKHYYTGIKVE